MIIDTPISDLRDHNRT